MSAFLFLLSSLIVSLFLSVPAAAQNTAQLQRLEPTEHIYIDADGVHKALDGASLVYRTLVGEVAVGEGDFELASETFLELARDTDDPRFAERAFRLAMADQNLNLGVLAARLWAELDADSAEARASALALEASAGETEGMAQTLRQRIEIATDKEQAVYQAMGIVSRMVDPYLALEVFEAALPDNARNLIVTHLALADLAWAAGHPGRAAQEARLALQLSPDSEAAASRVLEYGLADSPERAFIDARAYAKAYPQARQLQLMLINRLVEFERHAEALEVLQDMQAQNPEDFDLLFIEAEVYRQGGQFAQAKQLLDEYIQVQIQRRLTLDDQVSTALDRLSDARLALVQIAEQQEDYEEAIRQLELIEEPRLQFQAQVHRAVLEGRMGQLAQAQMTLDTAKARTTQDEVVVELTRASIYRSANKVEKAIEVLERANRQMPDTPEIKYDLGMLHVFAGEQDKFEQLMREIIELDPDNANAYNALGYTFADQNRNLDEAQDLLEQALELEPDNPYILDSVGWYLYRVGDLEAAYEYLYRSYVQLPAADVAAHLGEVLWVKGRKEAAMEIWQAAHEQEPDNDTLVDTLERFGVSL